MKINAIDFIVTQVSDVQKSIPFYRDILGLSIEDFNQEADWAEFSIGTNTLALCGPNAQAWGVPHQIPTQTGTTIALAVENIDEALEELRRRNVPILTDKKDSTVCYFAIISDPDGNCIWLHQGYADYHKKWLCCVSQTNAF